MLLCLLIFIPLLGSIFCFYYEYKNTKITKWIALYTTILSLSLSIFLWIRYFYCPEKDINNNWNIEYIIPWISTLGIKLHLSLDILSLIMILLSSVFSIISVLCSWNNIKRKSGYFYFNLLLILFGTFGALLSCDLFLFFCFWEIMLFPIYFLIIFWGCEQYTKEKRNYIANKFLIYTQLSSMLMFFSIILLSFEYYKNNHIWTFNYNLLSKMSISLPLEFIIMLGFFISFAVKIPLFPFHSWLPNVHAALPINSSIDLLGILIKMGIYGLIRFNLHLFPISSYFFSPIVLFLSFITIFYAAIMAFIEKNIKKILGYGSMSHMGIIVIALYCNNYITYQGAILQIIFNSFSTAALFVLFSQLYQQYNTNNINKLSGFSLYIKYFPSLLMFFIFTNLNFPGTINFFSEIMILLGTFYVSPYISYLLIFSLFVSVLYSIKILHKILYSSNIDFKYNKYINMNTFTFYIICFFLICILFSGLLPIKILHLINF